MSRNDWDVLHGKRVMVVEDESLVAMQLEDMLLDLGCEVAGTAMRLQRGLDLLETLDALDAAVVDVNLGNGETVYPLAERLRTASVPLVFATGYGRKGVADEWHDRPILQKPYTIEQLAEGLRAALACAGAPRT